MDHQQRYARSPRHAEYEWRRQNHAAAQGHLVYDTAWRKPAPKPTFFQRLRAKLRRKVRK